MGYTVGLTCGAARRDVFAPSRIHLKGRLRVLWLAKLEGLRKPVGAIYKDIPLQDSQDNKG